MKKVTEITCKMSKSILLTEGHLTLTEVKEFLSKKNLLESDFDDNSDDSDIDFSYYTVDDEEITKDTLTKEGKIFHSETHKINEAYYFNNVLEFVK